MCARVVRDAVVVCDRLEGAGIKTDSGIVTRRFADNTNGRLASREIMCRCIVASLISKGERHWGLSNMDKVEFL